PGPRSLHDGNRSQGVGAGRSRLFVASGSGTIGAPGRRGVTSRLSRVRPAFLDGRHAPFIGCVMAGVPVRKSARDEDLRLEGPDANREEPIHPEAVPTEARPGVIVPRELEGHTDAGVRQAASLTF